MYAPGDGLDGSYPFDKRGEYQEFIDRPTSSHQTSGVAGGGGGGGGLSLLALKNASENPRPMPFTKNVGMDLPDDDTTKWYYKVGNAVCTVCLSVSSVCLVSQCVSSISVCLVSVCV